MFVVPEADSAAFSSSLSSVPLAYASGTVSSRCLNNALTTWQRFSCKLQLPHSLSVGWHLDNLSTSVLMSVMMIVVSLERISSPLLAVGKAMVAACEFFTVIDAPGPTTGTLKEPDVTATEDIVFKDVTFAYPGRPHAKVLDGLNLTIEAGKLTAIVGPSGSGKSTIVGLIQRWYTLQDQYVIEKAVEKDKKKKKGKKSKNGDAEDESSDDDPPEKDMPEEETQPKVELTGTITTAGGTPLDDIETKWWRSQIGLVQQEPFLFNDTIYQNVAYGLVGSEWAEESEERKRELVTEACKEAFADEFIDRLPDVSPPLTFHFYTKAPSLTFVALLLAHQ